MTKATRQFLLILLGLAIGLSVVAGFRLPRYGRRRRREGRRIAIGGPFALTAPDGRTVTNADLAGRPYLVFFGYTHCPDFCPATLTEISAVLKQMGADAKIAALFVTIDPERDTPQTLKAYLDSFDPRIIGLHGDAAQTERRSRGPSRSITRKSPASTATIRWTTRGSSISWIRTAVSSAPSIWTGPPRTPRAELARYL